jgi:hypothetical protein
MLPQLAVTIVSERRIGTSIRCPSYVVVSLLLFSATALPDAVFAVNSVLDAIQAWLLLIALGLLRAASLTGVAHSW